MEMDSNMLRYFTSNFISPHSTTVKFMEVYPHYDQRKLSLIFCKVMIIDYDDDDADDGGGDDYTW